MNIVLSILFFILSALKIIDLVYRFQIKEYRFDRFVQSIYDEEIVQILLTKGKLPAKTIRNILISFFSFIVTGLWAFIIRGSDILVILSLFLFPIYSFSVVYSFILVTEIVSSIKKNLIITRAKRLINKSDVITIGITGSYGKTTTKEYLYEILSTHYNVAKTEGNFNTDIGVALSIIKNIKKDTDFFIAEMGAYRQGEIADICRITRPLYAIIPGIGNQHLGLFGSKEKLINAKKELLHALPSKGKAYINSQGIIKNAISSNLKIRPIFYSKHDLIGLSLHENLSVIRLNLVPCIMLARELKVPERKVEQAIKNIYEKKSGLSSVVGWKQTKIIDNSYNTSVESFIHMLHVLAKHSENNKIMVNRGIIELGREKKNSYARILNNLGKSKVILYTTDVNFKNNQKQNVRYFRSEKMLLKAIMEKAGKNTVIAFEGRFDKKYIQFLKKQ
ncbi:MAG: Mur ligase family protein [Patescibacteria group bacterium]